MKIKNMLLTFIIGFAVTFVVNAGLVYGWNYFVHSAGLFNWPLSFFFAVTLGILCAFIGVIQNKSKKAVVAKK
ncbi:MAG: hypothetical protein JXA92_10250 [candidate division Zixibacteria bacterium]|nr:hypothetical protein [candidate division Zixibacteria bacterium]